MEKQLSRQEYDKEKTIYDYLEPEYAQILRGLCDNAEFKIIVDSTIPTLATPIGKKEIYCNPKILEGRSQYGIIALFSHEIGHHDTLVRLLGNNTADLLKYRELRGISLQRKSKLDHHFVNIIEDIVLERHQSRAPYQYMKQYFKKNAEEILLDSAEKDMSQALLVEQLSAILLLAGRDISLEGFSFSERVEDDKENLLENIKVLIRSFSSIDTWSKKLGHLNSYFIPLFYSYLKKDFEQLEEEDWDTITELLEATANIYPEEHRSHDEVAQKNDTVILPSVEQVNETKARVADVLDKIFTLQQEIQKNQQVEQLSNLYKVSPETAKFYLDSVERFPLEIQKLKTCLFELLVKDRGIKISSEVPQGFGITPGLFTLGVSMAEQGIEEPPIFQNICEYPRPSNLAITYQIDTSGSMRGAPMLMSKVIFVLLNQAFLEIIKEYSHLFTSTGEDLDSVYTFNLALFNDVVLEIMSNEGMNLEKLLLALENITMNHGTGGNYSNAMTPYFLEKYLKVENPNTIHIGIATTDGQLLDSKFVFEHTFQETFGMKEGYYGILLYTNHTPLDMHFSENIVFVNGGKDEQVLIDKFIAQMNSTTRNIRGDRGNGFRNFQWSML